MPAETKPREANRAGELEDRLSTLGQQRRLAADAITAATQRVEEIVARQQQIAVAVVSEDEEAVTENEQLEEALLIENRRRATARSCGRAACSLLASLWGDGRGVVTYAACRVGQRKPAAPGLCSEGPARA